MKIKWNKLAVKQLLDIVQYLEDNDLMEYAERIEYQILSKIKSLPDNLATFQADRLKKNNDGTFHAFEIDSYRVSFRKINSEIRILRIRLPAEDRLQDKFKATCLRSFLTSA